MRVFVFFIALWAASSAIVPAAAQTIETPDKALLKGDIVQVLYTGAPDGSYRWVSIARKNQDGYRWTDPWKKVDQETGSVDFFVDLSPGDYEARLHFGESDVDPGRLKIRARAKFAVVETPLEALLWSYDLKKLRDIAKNLKGTIADWRAKLQKQGGGTINLVGCLT